MTDPLFVKGEQFFKDIQPECRSDLHLVIVSHLLDGPQIFLTALQSFAHVAMVIPKPKSLNRKTLEHTEQRVSVLIKNRKQLESPAVVTAVLNDAVPSGDMVVVDIGGYFASAMEEPLPGLKANLLGVVEVTENGFQRYQQLDRLGFPVVSLARSPLKGPEDYLTGQSIVYSAEALMRSCHKIMNGDSAVVFGYGKIGRSIAKALHAKNINTKVVEIDPIRAIEAHSRGFDLIDKLEALKGSDVVFCATGNQSLSKHDFAQLKNGAFIFSVTSSDDELDLGLVGDSFTVTEINPYISRYEQLGQYFYLANRGDAINFIHNAELGPYIFLLQGELMRAIEFLCAEPHAPEITELPDDCRKELASKWLVYFG